VTLQRVARVFEELANRFEHFERVQRLKDVVPPFVFDNITAMLEPQRIKGAVKDLMMDWGFQIGMSCIGTPK